MCSTSPWPPHFSIFRARSQKRSLFHPYFDNETSIFITWHKWHTLFVLIMFLMMFLTFYKRKFDVQGWVHMMRKWKWRPKIWFFRCEDVYIVKRLFNMKNHLLYITLSWDKRGFGVFGYCQHLTCNDMLIFTPSGVEMFPQNAFSHSKGLQHYIFK